eukprot:jgi/Mesvir1/26587/Mv25705-RA.3
MHGALKGRGPSSFNGLTDGNGTVESPGELVMTEGSDDCIEEVVQAHNEESNTTNKKNKNKKKTPYKMAKKQLARHVHYWTEQCLKELTGWEDGRTRKRRRERLLAEAQTTAASPAMDPTQGRMLQPTCPSPNVPRESIPGQQAESLPWGNLWAYPCLPHMVVHAPVSAQGAQVAFLAWATPCAGALSMRAPMGQQVMTASATSGHGTHAGVNILGRSARGIKRAMHAKPAEQGIAGGPHIQKERVAEPHVDKETAGATLGEEGTAGEGTRPIGESVQVPHSKLPGRVSSALGDQGAEGMTEGRNGGGHNECSAQNVEATVGEGARPQGEADRARPGKLAAGEEKRGRQSQEEKIIDKAVTKLLPHIEPALRSFLDPDYVDILKLLLNDEMEDEQRKAAINLMLQKKWLVPLTTALNGRIDLPILGEELEQKLLKKVVKRVIKSGVGWSVAKLPELDDDLELKNELVLPEELDDD